MQTALGLGVRLGMIPGVEGVRGSWMLEQDSQSGEDIPLLTG